MPMDIIVKLMEISDKKNNYKTIKHLERKSHNTLMEPMMACF